MKIYISIAFLFVFTKTISAQNITYYYDDLGRLTKTKYQDSTILTYTYDASGNRITTSIENVCLSNPIRTSISSGNWNDPSTWRCSIVPSLNDSAVVSAGHTVIVNNSAQVRKLYVENGGSISLNDSAVTFSIGSDINKTSPVICNGLMEINNGNFKIYGNLSLTSSSHFNMSGGNLIIDGNTGVALTSIPDGQHLFNVSAMPANFNFSGGILKIINPPFGVNSQSINCSYNFSAASTLVFGDGISTIASNNQNGFGGNLLPAEIGKLIFDPATSQNNRIFKNLNPLIIRTRCDVKSGNLIQSALLQIIDSLSIVDIDGNIYPVVTICNKQWIAKNLEVTHYRNGDTIPQVQNPAEWANLTTGAWCYYQDNTANGAIYGKLYNWFAVNDPRGLAPAGWHIPTNAEWLGLADNCLEGSAIAGGKMKTTGLLLNNTGLWGGNYNNSTNSSGFSGVPAGIRLIGGAFTNLGAAALWWSATSTTSLNAAYREADQEDDYLYSGSSNKKLGLAVRCIKD